MAPGSGSTAGDSPEVRLTYKSVKRWKSVELKQYLRDRKQQTSGRKDDLVDRICLLEGLSRAGNDGKVCKQTEEKRIKILPSHLLQEYRSLPSYERIPGKWKKGLGCMPDAFSLQKMKEYLLYSTDKTCDGDSVRHYKTLRSYKMF